ncbi:hypothetical protein RRG08_055167 [Elysia crispata]|uniref:Uncharacterized protein n=1 Tax=Elysia crispata TaxID=231223 RepID=A0AAE1D041_9GAST|nr:hypothetical protein RRG08_055167 [Elysia crispata]
MSSIKHTTVRVEGLQMNSTVKCTQSRAIYIISVVMGLRELGDGWAPPNFLTSHEMTINSDIILDWSSPVILRTAPSVVH